MRVTETAAVVTLGVVLLKVLLAGVSLHIGDWSVTVAGIDATVIGALLVPVLGAPHLQTYVEGKKND